jgi:predicted O-methyltransferase YrrM
MLKGIARAVSTTIQEVFFLLFQRAGFHVTRNHFDSPIPDTIQLKDDLWLKRSELVGIAINEQKQTETLAKFKRQFKNEYDTIPRNKTASPHTYYFNNGAFGPVDGEMLYCMILDLKPQRVIEIGAGNSTFLSAQAILVNKEENEHYKCDLVAIEPNPSSALKAGFPGLSALISKKVQDVPISEFLKLKKNDILFIDSSHVLKVGSDVQYEYMELLPRLNKGVVIHIHDIFWPREYKKEWVKRNHWFWNEQYLLQSFLAFNDSFEILWIGSLMHLTYTNLLEKAFSSYKSDTDWPSSLWMRKTR